MLQSTSMMPVVSKVHVTSIGTFIGNEARDRQYDGNSDGGFDRPSTEVVEIKSAFWGMDLNPIISFVALRL